MSAEAARQLINNDYGVSETIIEEPEEKFVLLEEQKKEHRPPPIKMRVIFQIKNIQICTDAHIQDIQAEFRINKFDLKKAECDNNERKNLQIIKKEAFDDIK